MASVLKAEYMLPKVTQKLENFLDLGWNEFLEELEKQRVRMDLTKKDNLNVWFRSKQNKAIEFKKSVEKLNQEINACVYKLYNLDDADIKVIEKSNNI
jgi:tyrosyl-tRNA synthetase